MTPDAELYERFLAHLRAYAQGAEHAQSAVTICLALGLEPDERNRRSLRLCAHHASRDGHLVCSGQRGYFLPATPAEVLTASTRLRAEAYKLLKRAARVDALAAELFALRDEPEPVRDVPPLMALMEAR